MIVPEESEIQKVVSEYQEVTGDRKLQMENVLSENWIKTNSQKCPKCQAVIEKIDGCNNMGCWRCNTFSCWLCSTILDRG